MKVENIEISEEPGNNVLIELNLDNGGKAWTWLTRDEDAEHVLLQLSILKDKLTWWIERDKNN
jgi:hypothetical protein